GCEALGVTGHAVPTARVDCIACGWTQFGCAYNRKSSQLITTIPRVSKKEGRIFSDARAEKLLVSNGRATGVQGSFVDRTTKKAHATFQFDAPVIVLSGGSLGTSTFLLNNVKDDTVGRRLYINPHFFIWADFGRKIDN